MGPANAISAMSVFEPLIGLKEAAALIAVHPDTLKKKVRSGEIPGIKVGRCWRFRASILDAWIRSKLISLPIPITPR